MEEPNDVVGDRLLRELLLPKNNSSNVSFSVNAGGVGVWISATAAVIMLVCFVVGGVFGAIWLGRELERIDARAAEQEVKIDRANTFLAAIWANAPELEKKIKAEQEQDSAE